MVDSSVLFSTRGEVGPLCRRRAGAGSASFSSLPQSGIGGPGHVLGHARLTNSPPSKTWTPTRSIHMRPSVNHAIASNQHDFAGSTV